jgi:hypothetical protein
MSQNLKTKKKKELEACKDFKAVVGKTIYMDKYTSTFWYRLCNTKAKWVAEMVQVIVHVGFKYNKPQEAPFFFLFVMNRA